LFEREQRSFAVAAQPYDHPVLQVFVTIRRIDDGVREALAELLPDGVTVPQFEVLRLIDLRGDGLSPAEIAQALHAPKSGLTVTLQRLEAAGFIAVEPHPEDRRKKRVRLTTAGRGTYARSIVGIRPHMDHLREAFTLGEFREVLPFLKALDAWFEERDWA
jgi:DNA-binding MarR family transcriptional regulator